ncbi:MAG: putative monovalent cation/H+ antiporter subunit A [Pseudomonadota bacterium]
MAEAENQEQSGGTQTGLAHTLVAAALFLWFFGFLDRIADGEAVRLAWDWAPSLGISFSFVFDGLSLTFALLISGIGTLIHLYSSSYLGGHPQYRRFALYLTAFMVSMLGLVLADNLIALFVFWELTTITSYLLIGFGHETTNGRRSALQAMLVTGAGALAMLAGFILLGRAAGTFEISEILLRKDLVLAHDHFGAILILVLLGAFTKSAQVPFHFWLPNAMAAPTPVSAFLHSATMVKGGVYLMARLYPAFSASEVWVWTLTIFGAVTAVFASVMALRQTDLKQALAYTTLMALGTLTLYLGQSSEYAITAFATFLIVHSFYKAALFLVVGAIDHGTGTRDAEILGGLGRAMPFTALAAALAAASMAGLPPFLGFIGKELLYAGSIRVETSVIFVTGMVLVANALMFTVSAIVAFRPFWRPSRGRLPVVPHEAPWQMLAGPLFLAACGTAFGIFPGLVQHTIVDPIVGSLLGDPEKAKELHLWAGINVPFVLSLVTYAIGLALYIPHQSIRGALARLDAATPTMDDWWDALLAGFRRFARWLTAILQPGDLRTYLATTFMVVIFGFAGTMLVRGLGPLELAPTNLQWSDWFVFGLIVGSTGVVVATSSRITAVAALGVGGIGVALTFISFGAPDVAITQLLVETLVVVLVGVAMLRMPFLDELGSRDRRPADALIAVGVGVVVSLVVLAVLAQPIDLRLTEYFEKTSAKEAFGQNIVNVILVDFRALDTFGEISVVLIAGLASYALLRTTVKHGRDEE